MFTPFEAEEDQLDETDGFQVSNAYTFVKEQTYIGLYSSTHFELFYLFFVTKKAVATESKSDIFGHLVQEGESYLEGYHLEKTKETKDRIFYKKIQKPVFIHAEEIFMPAVAIDEESLSLSRMEHIYLSDCV